MSIRARKVSAVMAATALVLVGCASTSARSLLSRAASVEYPARFVFVDRPDAASLLECLGAAETLVVAVDTDQSVMAVVRDGEVTPVVIWTAAASFVDASLLTTGSGWVRIERELAEPARSDVELAVGVSLSGYVFAERLSPTPVAVAISALAVAGEISESQSSSGELAIAVEVDESIEVVEGLEVGSLPDLEFRLIGEQIVAIVARQPSAGEEPFGFVWEYDPTSVVPQVSVPQRFTEFANLAGKIGTGNRGAADCAIGL
ncbi:MAG TPA: hypothetical protein PK020_20810 [Ilumatobacteraceae bacterium]|nr:hypothetical protein [Ilumatobacteraceae bacterium]